MVLPAPGETAIPIPEVLEAPSMVIGAEGSGAITDWSPTSWNPPNEVSLPDGMLRRMGPSLVEMATLAGTTMGNVSPARTVVWPETPTMTILVPAAPTVLATESAWVTVLKLQVGVATPAAMPLPVAVPSSPLIGSTK